MSVLMPGVLYQNGHCVLNKVGKADSFAERTRGWLGRDPSRYNAIWLTHTAAVHTFFMPRALELLWLDKAHRCLRQQILPPGRIDWCMGARSVVEALPGLLDNQEGNQFVWKPYLSHF